MPSILVVEDDKDAREGYLEFLSCSGFEPVGVGDGCEALNIAIATLPAAVITDISIPGLNGFDLAAILRRERLTRHIPIIGLTGHWSTDVQMKAAESKMAAVLLKPCMPAHLLAEIQRVLASPVST
jgi:CheY-like chemotaxis protein